jgi:EAL domain-containing protein (putative c-di-GMP-specific phosphodiesterase class I)
MDCQQCIWGEQAPEIPPCEPAATERCALKRLVDGAAIEQGQMTTARFGDYTLTSAFQPIYSLSHERVIAYEALVRGIQGNETISPWEIISSANNFEDTVRLDRLCRTIHLHNFKRHFHDDAWLFININPQVVVSGRQFGTFFGELLASTGIPPQRIVVEILEHAIQDEQLLAEAVHYYRNMGCLIALDDFGSGHSNFERILRLRPDIVKLDTGMIRQAGDNVIARRIMPNLIAMLHEAGCLVLMEGVETREEALIALDCNVDFVQGFYFARPGTPSRLETRQNRHFHLLNRLYKEQFDQVTRQREQDLAHYKQHFAQAVAFYTAGIDLNIACQQLLSLPRVQRCYVLDHMGSQLGDNLYPPNRQASHDNRFQPLADTRGANWNRKPYFRNAIIHPGKVKVTRPYLSISGVEMCITLSISIEVEGELRVICCDLSYQDHSVQDEAVPQGRGEGNVISIRAAGAAKG